MLICSVMSVSAEGPCQIISAPSSAPAASAPALTVCQKECAVPFGSTAIRSFCPPPPPPAAVCVPVGPALSVAFCLGQPIKAKLKRTATSRPPHCCRLYIHRCRLYIHLSFKIPL